MIRCGPLIDALYKRDAEIDKVQAVLRKAKQRRNQIEEKLFTAFKKEELNGAAGSYAKARIAETRHPVLRDRAKFMKYVLAHKAWDLFQNRIASRAYFDRIEEGERIGGVEIFNKVRISVTKVRK